MEIFILDKWKKERKMEKESIFQKKVGSLKGIFMIMKNMEQLFKSMKMEICTLELSLITKSMVMENFIGLVWVQELKKKQIQELFSIMMVNGGVDCQMDKGFIKRLMVSNIYKVGDLYTGHFKNGLKHGQGSQHYGNGDYYKGEYINGLPEGFGEYLWSDGSFYKGDFKQGLRNGYGFWSLNKEEGS